jgi:hypothetical protein
VCVCVCVFRSAEEGPGKPKRAHKVIRNTISQRNTEHDIVLRQRHDDKELR